MTYLLDTHYLLWAAGQSKKLSKKIKDIITNPENRIVVSAVSFWEISLKSALGKLDIDLAPQELPAVCEEMGFEIESLSVAVSSTYYMLKAMYHRDPFDRMLIWQAICNNYILISNDSQVKKYTSEGLKVFGGG